MTPEDPRRRWCEEEAKRFERDRAQDRRDLRFPWGMTFALIAISLATVAIVSAFVRSVK